MCTKICDRSFELFQSIIDDEKKVTCPKKALLPTLKDKRKMLEQKWMILESIRERLNQTC